MDARARAHWEAVGKAFADDTRQRDLDAERLTPEQRILEGLRMGRLSGPQREEDYVARARLQVQLHAQGLVIQAKRKSRGHEP